MGMPRSLASVQRQVAIDLVVTQQVADAQPQAVFAQTRQLQAIGRVVRCDPPGSQISRQRLR